jgi:hypothetical protein
LLKARIVKPEKEPFLAKVPETTFVSRQRLGKYIPAATNTHAILEVLLETVYFTLSVQKGYKEDNWDNQVSSVWESVRKRDSCKGGDLRTGAEK